jgi:hypothetical protein
MADKNDLLIHYPPEMQPGFYLKIQASSTTGIITIDYFTAGIVIDDEARLLSWIEEYTSAQQTIPTIVLPEWQDDYQVHVAYGNLENILPKCNLVIETPSASAYPKVVGTHHSGHIEIKGSAIADYHEDFTGLLEAWIGDKPQVTIDFTIDDDIHEYAMAFVQFIQRLVGKGHSASFVKWYASNEEDDYHENMYEAGLGLKERLGDVFEVIEIK